MLDKLETTNHVSNKLNINNTIPLENNLTGVKISKPSSHILVESLINTKPVPIKSNLIEVSTIVNYAPTFLQLLTEKIELEKPHSPKVSTTTTNSNNEPKQPWNPPNDENNFYLHNKCLEPILNSNARSSLELGDASNKSKTAEQSSRPVFPTYVPKPSG